MLLAQSATSSTLVTTVAIAAESGTTSTSSRTTDITVTASQRRPPLRRCAHSIIGQVATTIIVAQMIAPRNGCRIQNEAAISPPMNSTVSTMRVSSRPWSSATGRIVARLAPGAAGLDVDRGFFRSARQVDAHVDAQAPRHQPPKAHSPRARRIGVAEALAGAPRPPRSDEAHQRPARRDVPAQLCLDERHVLVLVAEERNAPHLDERQ